MTVPDPTTEPALPPRPERPDCCGGGCAVCVLDGYFEDVQRWEREVSAILAAQTAPAPAEDD
ncbi:MAG: oxidoreductase-like domain-containing protein [Panacagrimonas sp.]